MVPHPTAPIIIYPSVSVVSGKRNCICRGQGGETKTLAHPRHCAC
jgi:hypothetical protein